MVVTCLSCDVAVLPAPCRSEQETRTSLTCQWTLSRMPPLPGASSGWWLCWHAVSVVLLVPHSLAEGSRALSSSAARASTTVRSAAASRRPPRGGLIRSAVANGLQHELCCLPLPPPPSPVQPTRESPSTDSSTALETVQIHGARWTLCEALLPSGLSL